MEKGYIQVYTGNGKGKTTCAMGLAFRAKGAGLEVLMVQFLKRGDCSEHVSAQRLGLDLDAGDFIEQPCWDKSAAEIWKRHTLEQYEKAANALESGVDVVILDEAMAAMHGGFLTKEQVVRLLDLKKPGTELVLTGRNAPDWLIDRADLVTSMEPVKHYLDAGVTARKGIEF